MTKILFSDTNSIITPRRITLGLLFYILLSFITYHQALENGYIWDDDQYVSKNSNLTNVEGLKNIWFIPESSPQYYPLTFTTFWLEYHLWELKPFGYHFNNILLHAINAFLIWLILSRLKVPGAFLAAAIFAIHPVHTESVAWIAERKNILSGFFCLSALYCYLRFSRSFPLSGNTNPDDTTETDSGHWPYYAASVILFICALLSKTITASLPAVIMVLIWWRNGSIKKHDIKWLIPMFVIGAGFGMATAWLEAVHVGAGGEGFTYGFVDRCLIAGRALWFYIGKLVWPKELMFIYPRWAIDAAVWWQYLFPLSFLFMLAGLYACKGRIGRGPFAAMLVFAGTLFPAIGFLNVFPHRYAFVADHFQYLASIAIITALSVAIVRIGDRWFSSPAKIRVFGFIMVILLFNLGLKTASLTFSYKDVVTLWKDTIARNEKCWLAYNNLASAYIKQKQYGKAIPLAISAIGIKPDYDLAHVNLANAYFYLQDYDNALVHYKNAIDFFIAKKDGNSYALWQYKRLAPECYRNSGLIYLSRKKYDLALKYLSDAVALNPDLPYAHAKMGHIYSMQGKYKDAIRHYRIALPQRQNDPVLHNNFGAALLSTGLIDQSISHFKRVLEILPDNKQARINLKTAEQKLANLDETSNTR